MDSGKTENTNDTQIMTILREVSTFLNLSPAPKLEITNKSNGWAITTRLGSADVEHTIEIPEWVMGHGLPFMRYYVVHECTHIKLGSKKHNLEFKSSECETLATMYDIGIRYSRAYPKSLFGIADPQHTLWGRDVVGSGMHLPKIGACR